MKRVSKNFIKSILIKWLGKVNKFFFDHVWKKRNEDMLIWEQAHNISKNQKYKKINTLSSNKKARSKKEQREINKILYSGKKKSSVHILNETLYNKVKSIFGLVRSNFHRVLDKKII